MTLTHGKAKAGRCETQAQNTTTRNPLSNKLQLQKSGGYRVDRSAASKTSMNQ
jgi:hypothetical protein